MKHKHSPGPWKAHLNVPSAAIPGHLIKTDDRDGVQFPIALLWEGGGSKGKPLQVANALLIAAAPELLAALEEFLSIDNWEDEDVAPADLVQRARAAVKNAKEGRK